ncbi:MAG TPA: tRNA lysidine(34) synthetase TilS, partial [Nitrospirota bacterium]|nr:tRNA lysidine(34) synthetase TilS [Nitrospirota bacterium]
NDLMPGLLEGRGEGLLAIRLDAFTRLPEAIKRRALREALRRVKGDLLSVGYGHVVEAVNSIAAGGTGRVIHLPGGVVAERSYGKLLIYSPGDGETAFSFPLPVPGSVEIPQAGITVEAAELPPGAPLQAADKNVALFDLDKIDAPLAVRSRRPGDCFYPAGMEGRKKLKEFFIDKKVPRRERARAPLLACGDEIAWVMGMRQDRRYAAGPDTRRVLGIRVIYRGI